MGKIPANTRPKGHVQRRIPHSLWNMFFCWCSQRFSQKSWPQHFGFFGFFWGLADEVVVVGAFCLVSLVGKFGVWLRYGVCIFPLPEFLVVFFCLVQDSRFIISIFTCPPNILILFSLSCGHLHITCCMVSGSSRSQWIHQPVESVCRNLCW